MIVNYAKTQKVDGIICGHLHSPNLKNIEGVIYGNSGDWVDSCSALVEDINGELTIIKL